MRLYSRLFQKFETARVFNVEYNGKADFLKETKKSSFVATVQSHRLESGVRLKRLSKCVLSEQLERHNQQKPTKTASGVRFKSSRKHFFEHEVCLTVVPCPKVRVLIAVRN